MGKGDKRSFKGKVFKGSYGKTRKRMETRKGQPAEPVVVAPVTASKKK